MPSWLRTKANVSGPARALVVGRANAAGDEPVRAPVVGRANARAVAVTNAFAVTIDDFVVAALGAAADAVRGQARVVVRPGESAFSEV